MLQMGVICNLPRDRRLHLGTGGRAFVTLTM